MQEQLFVPAHEVRGPLLDDPQTEGLEDRHEVRQLDLAPDLVQADPGEGLALVGLVREPDDEGLVAFFELLEPDDVLGGEVDAGRGFVVVGEPRSPAFEQTASEIAVQLLEPGEEPVVPRSRDLGHLALERIERDVWDLALRDVHGEVDLRETALGDG